MPSNLWSGRERYALDICRHFDAAGWDVSVMTRDARVVDTPFEECGIRVMHTPFHGIVDRESVKRIARVMRDIPRGATAVVHTHRYRDALRAVLARHLAKRPEIRIVNTRHSVRPATANCLARRLYRAIDAHIFVSRRAAEEFLSPRCHGEPVVSRSNVHILHDSLLDAPATITPMPERGAVTTMFHGPLRPGKGLETLIDAMGLVKDRKIKLRLRIMGNGSPDYIDALRLLALRRGVMDMIDWRRADAWPLPMIGTVHFGVMPSVVTEAFGLPAAEYMAMGRPVICTATGAQPEYLSDGDSALFVPPGDARALAGALCQLARDSALRTDMGEAAFSAFHRILPWEAFARRLETIYTGKPLPETLQKG